MKCCLDRSRDTKSEEVPFCMGCYDSNQIRNNGIRQDQSHLCTHAYKKQLSKSV